MGRPFVCVGPEQSCGSVPGPWLCPANRSVFCGLQRDGSSKLRIGSDGLPVPTCVASTDASAAACGRPGIKPLPANLTGGSGGSQGWTPIQLSGTFPNGSSAGVIASIGSDGYSGGPAYFAGNGSDSTVVVKVLVTCSIVASRLYDFHRFVQFIVSAVADSILQCALFFPSFSHIFCCACDTSFIRPCVSASICRVPQVRPFCEPDFKWSVAITRSFSDTIFSHKVCTHKHRKRLYHIDMPCSCLLRERPQPLKPPTHFL